MSHQVSGRVWLKDLLWEYINEVKSDPKHPDRFTMGPLVNFAKWLDNNI